VIVNFIEIYNLTQLEIFHSTYLNIHIHHWKETISIV